MRKSSNLVACVEKEQPRVVANVEFTLRQCEAAGLDRHPELSFELWGTLSGNCVLTCTRRDVYEHPTLGLFSQAKIVLDKRGEYNAGCCHWNFGPGENGPGGLILPWKF